MVVETLLVTTGGRPSKAWSIERAPDTLVVEQNQILTNVVEVMFTFVHRLGANPT